MLWITRFFFYMLKTKLINDKNISFRSSRVKIETTETVILGPQLMVGRWLFYNLYIMFVSNQ
jgi:hypothetical protein